jgi:hypothetical protein
MAILNLVCAEHNFLSMIENDQLHILETVPNADLLKVSKVHTLKSIYATQRLVKKPFALLNTLLSLFKKDKNASSLSKVEAHNGTSNDNSEVILFVNPESLLSNQAIKECIEQLQHDSKQIIIDGSAHQLACKDCPEKVYWSFVHWMETLQTGAVIGENADVISFIALKKSMLDQIVDFQFENQSVSYQKVV